MKSFVKYFTADSLEAATECAVKYFNCNKEDIFTEVRRGGNEVLPWLILAMVFGETGAAGIANMNGCFMIYYEDEGVYLELYPKRGSGTPLDREELSVYIQRKNIKAINLPEVVTLVQNGEGRVLIGPPQRENILGEDAVASIAGDDMGGFVRFLPPDEGGLPISLDEVKEKLRKTGIVFGIDEAALNAAFAEKSFGKTYLIARGLPPEHGVDGSLDYHFNTGPKTDVPKEIENGRIDYRTLYLFEPVKEGQLLVTRQLATQGVPGKSVRGSELKPRPGKEALMPKSKNTVFNDNKTAMFSRLNGMVDLAGGSINVSNVYAVKGDCDMSVGNISFDGSVVIGGNVISGLVIRASGGITISGVVEGSEIIAGGNIELKRGIQGMDKGRLTAGGTIVAQFIERATAIAGEDVIVDAIIHSTIEAGRSLIMKGKRGNVLGGSIRATSEVIAKVIGSVMNTQTDIEVGLVPMKRARIKFLQAEVLRLKEELDKLDKLEAYLLRGGANMAADNKEKILASAKENRSQNSQLFTDYSEELSRLEYEANHSTGGKVHVLDTVYPGTRITIATGMYRITEPIKFTTFKFHDGEVVFTACEASR